MCCHWVDLQTKGYHHVYGAIFGQVQGFFFSLIFSTRPTNDFGAIDRSWKPTFHKVGSVISSLVNALTLRACSREYPQIDLQPGGKIPEFFFEGVGDRFPNLLTYLLNPLRAR